MNILDFSNYFHKQNFYITSIHDSSFFESPALSADDLTILKQKSLIASFYSSLDEQNIDQSVTVYLKCGDSHVYVASLIMLVVNNKLCAGISDSPLLIDFNRSLSGSQLDFVVALILKYIASLNISGTVTFSLHPFKETIIKPFKQFFRSSETLLTPLAGRYVALCREYKDARLDYRKSVKPLINKTSLKFNLLSSLESSLSERDKLFNEYRALHYQAAGRVTRPIASWDIQLDMLKHNMAVLFCLSNDESLVGAAFFVLESNLLHYWSGSYDRNFSADGLSHVLVDQAIQWGIYNNIDFFNFGYPQYLQSESALGSTKLRQLTFFRQAFTSSMSIGANITFSLNLIV